MRVLLALLLHLTHLIYALFLRVHSLYTTYLRALRPPQPLAAPRHRLPKHLALVVVVDPAITTVAGLREAQDALAESVLRAVEWCRALGIKKLTVYERKDMLAKCTDTIRERLPAPMRLPDAESSESETDYPLTPPPSDHSLSRPLSPSDTPTSHIIPITKILVSAPRPHPSRKEETFSGQQKTTKRRQQQQQQSQKSTPTTTTTTAPPPTSASAAGTSTPKSDLLLCLISGESSKPAIAATARALAREESRRLQADPALRKQDGYRYELSVQELEQILEDESGLSPPDFMIVHPIDCTYTPPAPPELHGFPPWHIRLTEIYQNYPRETPSHRPSLLAQLGLSKRRLSPIPLEELDFRAALDEFAMAEFRFGK